MGRKKSPQLHFSQLIWLWADLVNMRGNILLNVMNNMYDLCFLKCKSFPPRNIKRTLFMCQSNVKSYCLSCKCPWIRVDIDMLLMTKKQFFLELSVTNLEISQRCLCKAQRFDTLLILRTYRIQDFLVLSWLS